MEVLYFIAMLVGVAWLAVWSVLPIPHSDKGWWPFDMAEDGAPQRTAGFGRAERELGIKSSGRNNGGTQLSWRDRAPPLDAPADAARHKGGSTRRGPTSSLPSRRPR